MKIIECIPNFSTSSKTKIKKIANSITEFPNIRILDINSDKDHNRSVITFIGPPESIEKAAFNMVKTAASLIDLSKHKGVHPRIGATDVLPLVPIKGITFKETVKLARKLGKKIEKDLHIPVYFYEKAATNPHYKNLANLRRDLSTKIQKKAGATAIGVRNFLIAYNINLDSNDLSIARKIATQMRKLPEIKALGLSLPSRNIVQVSMNLTNYKKTSQKQAFKKVETEAKKLGIKILEDELIGLTPETVLQY